jgi:hypothetical protein
MTADEIIAVLEAGAAFVAQAAPLAGALGPMGAAAGDVVAKVAGFAAAALQEAQGAETVASETDLATIKSLAATIAAENDALFAQIAAS